ncbi:MAG: DnaJ C-terminal domain-containing protein [Cyclonatronaceae bacterium]
MNYKDYYKILGVNRDSAAVDIKKAYRKLAAKYHPDANPDDEIAVQKFKDVSEAYEVLSDPEKKKIYDQVGNDWKKYHRAGGSADDFNWSQYQQQQGRPQGFSYEYQGNFDDLFGAGGGSPFSDFFDNLFGGGGFGTGKQTTRQYAPRNENLDVHATMEVTLEDVANGAEKTFILNNNRIRVKIPKGIKSGQKLKLAGRGNKSVTGAAIGDLYIEIHEKLHPSWKRSGDDLIIEKKVDLYTMLLGGQLDLRTPRGTVKVTVPELTQTGKSLRLKGRGFPRFKNESVYGDLILKLNCRLPEQLTTQEKEMFEKLKEIRMEFQ